MKACSGLTAKGDKAQKCYDAFSNMVKRLIEHEGNLATSVCSKPSNKRQRSSLGCCGSGIRFGYWCWGGADGPKAGCCGCTQAIDNYCYADHGTCRTIDGRDVCPPDKWTCARWKVIPFASWFKAGDICADTTSNCAMEIATIGINALDIVANIALMCFTGGAGNVVKVGIKSGSKALLKVGKGAGRKALATAFKTAFKNGVKTAIWANVKSNLKKHFKKLPKELGNYLVEEMMAISAVKQAQEEAEGIDGAALAWDVAEIIDPTGIAAFTNYLVNGQDECKYPKGPTDQELSALQAIFKESENWQKSCGRTPHGGTETRKRYRSSTVRSPSSCESQIETQKRTCHHGQLTDWSGQRNTDGVLLSTKTSCRTETRHYRKMDCKQNCPSGWRWFETTDHGCCTGWRWWRGECGGNKKGCEKYTYRQARYLATDAVQEFSGDESFATAQSVIGNPADPMLHGFALIGLFYILHSSYKLCSKEQGYVDVPNKAEPQEI